jgi:tRNA dimethylallyltransferase
MQSQLPTTNYHLPTIAIVGPTASGKTNLALEVAEHYNGEIICADSRTVYIGMDIGTAKPTREEQARVRHWGLDLVEPGQPFSAADFKRYAIDAIADIRSRGKAPLLVGGTGLYIDAVLYDFTFGPPADLVERERLEAMTIQQLHAYCADNNITLPKNSQNKRHVITAIQRYGAEPLRRQELQLENYIVGIATNMSTLRTRIVERSEHLFANGVVEEASMLGKKYGWESEAMTGNIYPLLKKHHEGTLSLEQVKQTFITLDYQLAKRQMTWLRRNPDIMWCKLTEAKTYIQTLLATE